MFASKAGLADRKLNGVDNYAYLQKLNDHAGRHNRRAYSQWRHLSASSPNRIIHIKLPGRYGHSLSGGASLLLALVQGKIALPISSVRQVHNCAHFESRQTAWAYVIILAQLTPVVP